MNRRTLLALLGVSGLFMALPKLAVAAAITNKKLYGTYVGLSPILVSQGSSYEEAYVRFSLSNNGIVLWQTLTVDGTPLNFQVNFTSEWITVPIKGWGVDDGIAVRQHVDSKLAQLIFLFPPQIKGDFDAVMILGEGMPAVLGTFIRKERGDAMLRKYYTETYKPRVAEEQIRWLKPVDMVQAEEVMRSGEVYQKVQVLKDVEHNLWTGTEQEIAERLSLIERGINDPSSRVQHQALNAFVLGGRVTGGVELVVLALKRYKMLEPAVLEEAMDAAACLLYETYYYNKDVEEVRSSFGTTDVRAVRVKTGGKVTPEEFESLKHIVDTPASRRWTMEQQKDLRDGISAVVADASVSVSTVARQRGLSALADYPFPSPRPQSSTAKQSWREAS